MRSGYSLDARGNGEMRPYCLAPTGAIPEEPRDERLLHESHSVPAPPRTMPVDALFERLEVEGAGRGDLDAP